MGQEEKGKLYGIIQLERTQNLPKSQYFLPLDTHTCVCLSGVRNISFSENLAHVLNEWSLSYIPPPCLPPVLKQWNIEYFIEFKNVFWTKY